MLRALIPLAASAALLVSSAAAGELWVKIDKVSRYQIPDGVGRVILTNPSVADVEVASATELLFFGRVPGVTDVVFQTREGRRLGQLRVRVGNDASGLVTLYNGGTRYSFSCMDRCEQTMVVGDGELGDAARQFDQANAKSSYAGRPGTLSADAVKVEPAQTEPRPSPGS